MSIDESFTKTYHHRDFQHLTTVRHKGTVIAFAMDDARRIHYTVLDLANDEADPIDARNWLANPIELRFPSEIAEVGYAIASPTAMPMVTHGGTEIALGAPIQEEEKDLFRSTTARLTADAPFQVLSDERYVFVFRQAIDRNHADVPHQTRDGGASKSKPDDYVLDSDGGRVPIVDGTLLLDRFVLVETALQPKLEVRFRRSRHKTRPQSNKDSLGARDMDGRLFLEPTQELSFVRNLEGGRFTVLLLPTQIAAVQRWQIFACNAKTGMMDSWNVERSADGLFDTRGTRLYTSPDPEHAKDVLERQPGTCPFTDQPLVPVARDRGYAEWALNFDGGSAHVKVADGPGVTAGRDLTLKAWIKLPCHGTILSIGPLRLDKAGVLRFGVPGDDDVGAFRAHTARSDHDWHHVAFVLRHEGPTDADAGKQAVGQFYFDGEELATLGTAPNLDPGGPMGIGCRFEAGGKGSEHFTGMIDEVRLWTRARGPKEIEDERHYRLVGDEPGLAGYWRFDEGSGKVVHDQTDHARHGALVGDARWVASHAPVGDHPGMRRTSFGFAGRTIESAPTALLFHQNESAPSASGAGEVSLKRHARVMLKVATKADPAGSENEEAARAHIAALDLGVSREGRLAQIPDVLPLPNSAALSAETSINEQLDLVRQKRKKTSELSATNDRLRLNIDASKQALVALDDLAKDDKAANWPPLPDDDALDLALRQLIKELRQYKSHPIPGIQAEIDRLEKKLKDAGVFMYTDENYGNDKLWLPPGNYNLKDWRTKERSKWHDETESIRFRGPVNIRVWQHADRQSGHSDIIRSSIPDLGWWKNTIDFIEVFIAPDFREEQKKKNTERNEMEALREKLIKWRKKWHGKVEQWVEEAKANAAEIAAIEKKLVVLESKLSGGASVPMKLVHIDRDGLTTSGAILDFAWTKDSPRLLDSANGKLALYFRGEKNQFFAAYYDTGTGRATFALPAHGGGDVMLVARAAGSHLDQIAITVGEPHALTIQNSGAEAGDLSGWAPDSSDTWSACQQVDEPPKNDAPNQQDDDLAEDDQDEHEPPAWMERAHGGGHFFYGGGSRDGTLSQVIDLMAGADGIDAATLDGRPAFRLAAWIGSARADETGRLEVDWLDDQNDVAHTDSSGEQGPVFPLGTWRKVTLRGLVPQGAKRAKLRLCGTCCFDDLAFELAVGAEVRAATDDARTLVLDNEKTKVREVWHRMPPAPEAFAAVLNGAAGEPELIGFLDAMKTIEANPRPPTDDAVPAEAASPGAGLAEEALDFEVDPSAVTTTTLESEPAFEVVLKDPLPRQVPEGARLIVVDRTLTAVADDDRSVGTIRELRARLKQELPAGAALILLDDEPVAKQGELRITIAELPKPPLEPGAHLQLLDNASGMLVDVGKLASVTVLPSEAAELTLKAPLPRDVPARAQIVVAAAEAKASEAARMGARRIWIDREPPRAARTLILIDRDETQHQAAPIVRKARHLGPIIGKASGPLRCLVLKAPPKQKSFPAGAALRVGRALTPVMLKDDGQVLEDNKVHIEQTDFGELEDGTAVYLVNYDYRSHAEVRSGEMTWRPEHGSLLVTATAVAPRGPVETVQITGRAGTTPDCAWVADAPGLAIKFNGQVSLHQTDPDKSKRFDAAGDLTLEAWIRAIADGAGLPKPANVIQHLSQDVTYSLILEAKQPPERQQPKKDDLSGTFEAWMIIGLYDDYIVKCPMFELAMADESTVDLSAKDYNLSPYAIQFEDVYFEREIWTHVALIWTANQFRIYVDGALCGQQKKPRSYDNEFDDIKYWAFGPSKLDELRFWKCARTDSQIQQDRFRRLDKISEKDLIFIKRTGANKTIEEKSIDSPVSPPIDHYNTLVHVNQQCWSILSSRPFDGWTHVAAVYHQCHALEFNGIKDYMDCGDSVALDIGRDLTLEVFATVKDPRRAQGLLTRGRLNGGPEGQHAPYALYLDAEGRIGFAFADKDGKPHLYRSTNAKVAAGGLCKIAVTRKYQTDTKKYDKDGSETEKQDFATVAVKQWYDINIFVSQTESDYHKHEGPEPGRSSEALEIGRAYGTLAGSAVAGTQASHFEGVISEARIWNVALPPQEIGARIHGHRKGLVGWWRLEENEGHVAYDSAGQSHATIKGAEWVKNPDPDASTLEIYLDGERVETVPADPPPSEDTEEGFFLGRGFQGVLEEVRVWKKARTHEQILDNLFTRLKGEKEDLIAYYTFDQRPDEDRQQVSDQGARGNHLACQGKIEFDYSDAPISDDIYLVRSALAAFKTLFHGTIGSPASAEEYGDLQRDAKGDLTGTLKRCYSFIDQNGAWHLITGYKVGNLKTEWVAQVQADPQIIGYIEGAPPVPSENLTGSSMKLGEVEDYGGASAIELVEADDLTYIYASSEDRGKDTAVELVGALGFRSESSAGFGMETKIEEQNLMAGHKSQVEASWSQLSESTVSYGRNRGRVSRLELQGSWQDDDPTRYLNAAVGRRFIAANIGMAVVQSDTMDVFALRLAHNDAFVAYRMLPNPDIPKDWNLLTFPINPRYTKQGTLDGKVGCTEDGAMQCDPDYPNAITYGEWSYFKPREAYALKRRIERDRQELETHHADYETAAAGEGAGAAARRSAVPRDLTTRNLANTYVWTADGGFYSESTEVMESVSESWTGGYSFSYMGGATWEYSQAFAKVAVDFAGDALSGLHVETTKTKGKEQERNFSLEVELDGERDLQLYVNTDQEKERYKDRVNEGGGAYDEHRQPVLRPGKVDAYRFMTFYLEPSAGNFEDFFGKVVDPIWLGQSDAPHAVALRQAQQADKKPRCWRVMHRVTFVSRVLSDSDAAPTPQRKAKEEYDISSNYELIRRLEPYVRGSMGNADDFAAAVREALHRHLPKLKLEGEEEDEVVALMSDYCGVERETYRRRWDELGDASR